MILRNLQRTTILLLVYLSTINCQNERAYDTNDWIPITPSSVETKEETAKQRIDEPEPQIKRATGRVLNLDAPVQKFFPDEEYRYRKRRPQPQQQPHEQKVRFNGPKYKEEYKYVVPPQPHKGPPNLQYFTNQEVKLQTYEQPPPLPQPQRAQYNPISKPSIPATRDRAPPPNAASIYEQYNIPLNNTYYEAINPSAVNQELLGSLQNIQQNPAILDQQLLGAIQKNTLNLPAPTTLPPLSLDKEKESVQLVYVPLENLKPNQPLTQNSQTIYRQVEPPRQHVNTGNSINTKQHHLDNIQQDFIAQALQAQRLQEQFQSGQPILIQTTTTTTPKPKKRKPHQPPLAVYMEGSNKAEVTDVLEVLKDAKSIAVQDSVQPESPPLFIGPSSLNAPDGYIKFPLPYLNSVDGNRVERKVDNLPFFVAPLSYKTPPGYSKIPLPSPHVGSVVHKDSKIEKNPVLTHNQITDQVNSIQLNQISSTTARPQIYDVTSPTAIGNQNYYAQGQSLLSQPEYNQYNVNKDVKQYSIPSDYYLQQPELQTFNLPISTQLFDPSTNFKLNQLSYPQLLEQNDAVTVNKPVTKQPAKEDNIKTEEEPKEQKYTAPPTLQSTSNDYLEPLNYNQQNLEDTQHKVPVRQFQQPIRTKTRQNVKTTAQQSQYQDEIYNIPTRTTLVQPSRTQQYQTIQQNQYQDEIYNIPSRTTIQENRGTPSRTVLRPQAVQESDVSYTTPSRNTQSTRYNIRQNLNQEQRADGATVSITPRNTTPNPTTVPDSEGIITSYYSQNSPKPPVIDVNPLELAINEYELHQINTQLEEKPRKEEQYTFQQVSEQTKPDLKATYEQPDQTEKSVSNENYHFDPQLHRFANSPATILRDTYETTIRPTTKPRRRGRPTKPTTTPAPPSLTTKETYTVLEDFSAQQPSTSRYPQTPASTVDEVPASVYTLQTTTENSAEADDSKKLYGKPKEAQEYVRTEIEELPAKVYSLNVKQNAPVYSESVTQLPQHQHTLNQYAMDQQILQYNNKYGSQTYEEPSHENTYYTQRYSDQTQLGTRGQKQEYSDEDIKPLVHNRGQKQEYYQPNIVPQDYYSSSQEASQELSANQVPDDMAELVKTLQDQSVRTLLIPNLLAPTTDNSAKYQQPVEISSTSTTTTTTTTTERVPETTTHSRTRGRTRGGTRFSQSATTTRKPLTRRRPVHSSRITTDRSSSTTTDHSDFQKASTKQRFRTRARTTPSVVAERVSTTDEVYSQPRSRTTPSILPEKVSTTDNEVYSGPTSEATLNYYKPSKDLNSFSQYEHVVDQKRIVTNRPEIVLTEQYQRVYAPSAESPRPIIQYENTAQTAQPVEYYRSSPITESPHQIVVSSPKDYQREVSVSPRQEIEDHTKSAFRVRGRTRGKSRPTITTTSERPATRRTTSKPAPAQEEEEEQEYYGFIRAPNFKTSPVQQTQYAAATQQPQFYSNSFQNADDKVEYFSHHPKEDLRLKFDNTDFDTTTVRFLGEIKPKYPSTTTTETTTQTPRPRIRSRIRTSSSKKATEDAPPPRNHRPTYQPVNVEEQATRRSNVIRSRGKVHYEVPENLRPKSDEEADVVGGNYPSIFLQKQSTTANPSFQITVDPHEEYEEEDQKQHASMYRPRIARPDEWHEASEYSANSEGYVSDNKLIEETKDEENDESTTTEIPVALPIKATTEESGNETTDSSEEIYRQNQKAIDDMFQSVNKFEQLAQVQETTTEEDTPKGKRRGVWKLIRHRPLDHFETAESQNYHSVLNLFDEIKKESAASKISEKVPAPATYQTYNNYNPVLEQNSDSFEYESHKLNSKTTSETPQTTDSDFESEDDDQDEDFKQHNSVPSSSEEITEKASDLMIPTTTTASSKGNIFDSFYDMFGISFDQEEPKQPTTSTPDIFVTIKETTDENPTTTLAPAPTFPEEITDQPNTTPRNQTESLLEVNTEEEVATTIAPEVPKITFPVEPWEMKKVRTSTSTEISHETEICYKGRCIKAPSKKTRA